MNKMGMSEPAVLAAPRIATSRAVLLVAILFALQLADGIDQTALAFAAPGVRAELGLSAGALGAAFGAGFLGTALGSIVFGTLADRIGRKTALGLSSICFALGSLTTVVVQDGAQLFAIRLLTGVALGGLFPIVASVIVDVVSTGTRATAVTLVSVGTAAGASLCGPIFAVLEPQFGWHAIFYLGAIFPAVLVPLALGVIPDLRRVADESVTPRSPLASVTTLFRDGRWKLTLLIWAAFICSSFPMFFSLSWLPSLARAAQLPPAASALGPAVFSVSGLVTALVVARAIDRFGIVSLAATSAFGVPAFILLGQMFGGPQTIFLAACACAGAISVSCVNLMGAVAALVYDDGLRSRGVGWAVAVMRLGGAAAPAVGGILIGAGVATGILFAGLAVFPALTAFAVWKLRRLAGPGIR